MRLLRLVSFLFGVMALCWVLAPGAALAEEEDEETSDFGRTGFYIGVGGTLTKLMEANGTLQVEGAVQGSLDIDGKSSFGVHGLGGYRFHPHFAAEFEADWHSPFDVDFAYGTTGVAKAEVMPLVFTGNMKGYLFKNRFQPYAVVGVGIMTAQIKVKDVAGYDVSGTDWSTGFAARFGGGVDLYVTEHFVLNTEVRYILAPSPLATSKGLDMISLGWGLQYRF
jgi:opacity protein-like surface antigen